MKRPRLRETKCDLIHLAFIDWKLPCAARSGEDRVTLVGTSARALAALNRVPVGRAVGEEQMTDVVLRSGCASARSSPLSARTGAGLPHSSREGSNLPFHLCLWAVFKRIDQGNRLRALPPVFLPVAFSLKRFLFSEVSAIVLVSMWIGQRAPCLVTVLSIIPHSYFTFILLF